MPYQSDLEKKYVGLFETSPTLSNYLNWFSVYVWENLCSFAKNSITISKVHEEELTNNLVRDLARTLKNEKIALPIRLFHAKDEKKNGQDIEIIIQIDKDQYVLLACQAKILYVNELKNNLKTKYKSLGHTVGEDKKIQIDLLVDHAKKEKCLPVYLFYNYTEYPIPDIKIEMYLYGCSLLNALYLKEKCTFPELSKQTFQALHPPASPLNHLTKIKDLDTLKTLFGEATMDYSIKSYTLKEIQQKGKWIEIEPPLTESTKRLTGVQDLDKIISTQKEIQNAFNPAFRIIITQENLMR
ncbi:MAG: hypothetical protein EAZ97_05115 [Bacteroidetes bacterium]|nr:MAG: hypothetical protein EAZ97_05115 [Bacteroidota bacterium]